MKPVKSSQTPTVIDDGYLRISQIIPHVVPVAQRTWWRWVRDGRAPKPVRIGRVTVWTRSAIDSWIADHTYGKKART